MKAICEKIPKTILVLGPSGSGKDTQIDKIVEMCGFEKIGTGDMFRVLYEEKTEAGLKAYEYWGKGVWVPDELVYELFPEWLKKYDARKGWIFSQVVRAPGQVKLFDELMEKFDRKLELVIHYILSEEAAIERMSLRRHCPKCGEEYHLKYVPPKNDEVCDNDGEKLVARDDDKIEAIQSRLNEYNTKVLPVVDAYKKRGIVEEIDASPMIEKVWASTQEVLRRQTSTS